MTNDQPFAMLITIVGEDRVGLISAITGYLFEAGANLADTSFAVLGEGFEFSAVAEFQGAEEDPKSIAAGLAKIAGLEDAAIRVVPFRFRLERGSAGRPTHLIHVEGGDRPGLLARMTEVFMDYGVNIVRLTAVRYQRADGGFDYRTYFAVAIPEGREDAVAAAVHNTAGQLGLSSTAAAMDDS